MRQDQGRPYDKHKHRSKGTPVCIVSQGKCRPEQRMRHPHFGRKSEHQWAEQGGGAAGENEGGAVARAVGDESPAMADEGRDIEKKSIADDSAVWMSCKSDRGFGRPKRKEENRYAVR